MKIKECCIRDATYEELMAYHLLESLKFCNKNLVKCVNCIYNIPNRDGLSICVIAKSETPAHRLLEGKEIVLE